MGPYPRGNRRLSPIRWRLGILLFPFLSTSVFAGDLTLSDAYALALKRSETLAAEASSSAEARSRVDELRAALFPTVSLKASRTWQDEAAASGSSSSSRRLQSQTSLSFHQPLFTGFREYAALRAGKDYSRAGDLDLERAAQLLYLDVAEAYLNVFRLRKEKESRAAVIAFARDRTGELKRRERLGRSRRGERLSAEALLAGLEADLADEERRERDARRVFAFLTGEYGEKGLVLPEFPPAPDLKDCLSRAAGRPDVAARAAEADAADRSASIVRREVWPSAFLDGNRYLNRTGSLAASRWDAVLSAEWPLFRGGAWPARRAQAKARREASLSLRDLALRKALLEVETAHDAWVTARAAVPLREKARALADDNVKAQTADYRLGLVTNLDVLNALQSLQESSLQRDDVLLDSLLNRVQLHVACGEAPLP